MSDNSPRRFYRLKDFVMVVERGHEHKAAQVIIDKLRHLATCHKPMKAYVFLNPERQLFFYYIEHQNVQYYLKNNPEWLVGHYTGRPEADDIADDLRYMHPNCGAG
jgi:hypothetical protein